MSAVFVLPDHLKESSVVKQDELSLKQRWIEAVTLDKEDRVALDDWLDNWLCTLFPFSFRYGGQFIVGLMLRRQSIR